MSSSKNKQRNTGQSEGRKRPSGRFWQNARRFSSDSIPECKVEFWPSRLDYLLFEIFNWNRRFWTIKASKQKIEELQANIVRLESEIEELTDKIKRPEQILLTETEFLNLLKNAPQQMRNYDFVGKDILLRSIFLNLQIDKQNKASFLCKPEFDGLMKSSDIHSGGDKAIAFEPIYYIITYLAESCKPEDFRLPSYSVNQRQQQVLDQDYIY